MTSTFMRFSSSILFSFLISTVLLSGCADRFEKSGSYTYLIPSLNSDGSYSWNEVELTSLNSPTKLEGSTAKIHYSPKGASTLNWGPVVEPKLTKSGNVWIPQDVPSAVALSTYASLERIRKWETAISPAAEKVYPRQIVLDIAVKSNLGTMTDNAMYVPGWDVVLVLPYSGGGIPLAVNEGIMAHEHFHVQFFHQATNDVMNLDDRRMTTAQENTYKENFEMIRAWNEGLADFYGYAFTHQARFMDASKIGNPVDMLVRALDIPFESLSRSFMEGVTSVSAEARSRAEGTCRGGSYYCLGTQVSRLLFQMSEGSPVKTNQLIRRMYETFPEWKKSMNAQFTKTTLRTEDFLTWMFSKPSAKLETKQCDLLKKAMGSNYGVVSDCR